MPKKEKKSHQNTTNTWFSFQIINFLNQCQWEDIFPAFIIIQQKSSSEHKQLETVIEFKIFSELDNHH